MATYVIFDTNIIEAEKFSPESIHWRLFRTIAKANKFKAAVPWVVVEELTNHLLTEAIPKLNDTTEQLLKFVKEAKDGISLFPHCSLKLIASETVLKGIRKSILSYDQGRKAVANRLKKLFGQTFVQLDNIDITHAEIVSRYVNSKRPFGAAKKSKDAGYKDQLIWHSILAFLKENPEHNAIFVSSDPDYSDTEKKTFHSDFLDDLSMIPKGLERCELLTSLPSFTERYMVAVKNDENIRKELDEQNFYITVRESIHIKDKLEERFSTDFPHHFLGTSRHQAREPILLKIEDITATDNKDLLIQITCSQVVFWEQIMKDTGKPLYPARISCYWAKLWVTYNTSERQIIDASVDELVAEESLPIQISVEHNNAKWTLEISHPQIHYPKPREFTDRKETERCFIDLSIQKSETALDKEKFVYASTFVPYSVLRRWDFVD